MYLFSAQVYGLKAVLNLSYNSQQKTNDAKRLRKEEGP